MDKGAYVAYISGLYHIFRESVGTRLADGWPTSFGDVNDLRTAEQHDVDHGRDAGRKRKKLATTFSKYAGATSPDAASPSQWLLLQSNLLAALVLDLESLAMSLPSN